MKAGTTDKLIRSKNDYPATNGQARMEGERNCPVCFEAYKRGERPKHGKCNTVLAVQDGCKHFVCYECCLTLARKIRDDDESVGCPMCREDWTEFLWNVLDNYEDEDDEEEEEEEDEDDEEEEEEEDEVNIETRCVASTFFSNIPRSVELQNNILRQMLSIPAGRDFFTKVSSLIKETLTKAIPDDEEERRIMSAVNFDYLAERLLKDIG